MPAIILAAIPERRSFFPPPLPLNMASKMCRKDKKEIKN